MTLLKKIHLSQLILNRKYFASHSLINLSQVIILPIRELTFNKIYINTFLRFTIRTPLLTNTAPHRLMFAFQTIDILYLVVLFNLKIDKFYYALRPNY
jgi:hypothetical protein